MMYSQDSFSFLSEKMPQNLYQELLSYTQTRRKEETWNYNNKLAGALEQQSSLSDWSSQFEEYVVGLSTQLWSQVYQTCPWDFQDTKNVTPFIRLRNLWVNYQQQYELSLIHI